MQYIIKSLNYLLFNLRGLFFRSKGIRERAYDESDANRGLSGMW